MGPVVDHPDFPGAMAMVGPDGSLSPPVHPDTMLEVHPAGVAEYHEKRSKLAADKKDTLIRKVEALEQVAPVPAVSAMSGVDFERRQEAPPGTPAGAAAMSQPSPYVQSEAPAVSQAPAPPPAPAMGWTMPSIMNSGGAGGSGGGVQPAASGGAGGSGPSEAPSGGTPGIPPALDPKDVVTAPPAGPAVSGGPASPLRLTQAELLAQAAKEKLRSSPGYLQKGGKFETASTVQKNGMPAPDTVARQVEHMGDNPTLAGGAAGGGPAPDIIVGQDENGDPIWGPGEQTQDYDTPVNRGAADHRRAVIDANSAKTAEANAGARLEALSISKDRERETEDLKRASLDESVAEMKAVAHRIESSQVDPNRLWKDKSTGFKVAAAIGVMLGSMGDEMAGHPGTTVKHFEDAIDRDIKAQEHDIESKKHAAGLYQHIFQMNMQRFGSREAGDAARKAAMFQSLDAELAKSAAEATTAKQQLAVRETRVIVQQKIDDYLGQMQAAAAGTTSTNYQTVGDKYIGGKSPDLVGAAKLLGEAADAAQKGEGGEGGKAVSSFRLGGQEVAFRDDLSPAEKHEARKSAYFMEVSKQRLKQLDDNQKKFGNQYIFTKEGTALVRSFLSAKSAADHEGVTHKDDVDFGMDNLTGKNAVEAREALQQSIRDTEAITFDHYGTRYIKKPTGAGGVGGGGNGIDTALARDFSRDVLGKGAPTHGAAPAHPGGVAGPRMSAQQKQVQQTAAAYGVSPEIAAFLKPAEVKKGGGKK